MWVCRFLSGGSFGVVGSIFHYHFLLGVGQFDVCMHVYNVWWFFHWNHRVPKQIYQSRQCPRHLWLFQNCLITPYRLWHYLMWFRILDRSHCSIYTMHVSQYVPGNCKKYINLWVYLTMSISIYTRVGFILCWPMQSHYSVLALEILHQFY